MGLPVDDHRGPLGDSYTLSFGHRPDPLGRLLTFCFVNSWSLALVNSQLSQSLAKLWQHSANLGQHLANLGRLLAHESHAWPENLVKILAQRVVEVGRTSTTRWANIGQTLNEISRFGVEFVPNLGRPPDCAPTVAQRRSSPASPGGNFQRRVASNCSAAVWPFNFPLPRPASPGMPPS